MNQVILQEGEGEGEGESLSRGKGGGGYLVHDPPQIQ
jgi:hypothetical protein